MQMFNQSPNDGDDEGHTPDRLLTFRGLGGAALEPGLQQDGEHLLSESLHDVRKIFRGIGLLCLNSLPILGHYACCATQWLSFRFNDKQWRL